MFVPRGVTQAASVSHKAGSEGSADELANLHQCCQGDSQAEPEPAEPSPRSIDPADVRPPSVALWLGSEYDQSIDSHLECVSHLVLHSSGAYDDVRAERCRG